MNMQFRPKLLFTDLLKQYFWSNVWLFYKLTSFPSCL